MTRQDFVCYAGILHTVLLVPERFMMTSSSCAPSTLYRTRARVESESTMSLSSLSLSRVAFAQARVPSFQRPTSRISNHASVIQRQNVEQSSAIIDSFLMTFCLCPAFIHAKVLTLDTVFLLLDA